MTLNAYIRFLPVVAALVASVTLNATAVLAQTKTDAHSAEVEAELRHANTYYWLGRARNNSAIESHRSLAHIEAAEAIVSTIPAGPEKQKTLLRISAAKTQIREQLAHESDILKGVSPLLPTLFSKDPVISFSGDIKKVAFDRGLRALFQGNAGARLNMVTDLTYLLPLSDNRDALVEEAARRSLGDLTQHYVISPHEVAAALTPAQFESLYGDAIPPKTLDALVEGLAGRHMDISGIGIVHLVEQDRIDAVYYGGVYYRYWRAGQKQFAKHWYADGLAEQANPYAWLPALLILLAFPLQWVLVRATRHVDPQLAGHSSPPPAWLGIGAAGFSALVLAVAITTFRELHFDLQINASSIQGIVFYGSFGIGLLLVPLVVTFLVAARIPVVTRCINNVDSASSLIAGSIFGSLAILGCLSWLRLGETHTLTILAITVPTVAILSFQFARAYSDHTIRGSRNGLIQALLLLGGIAAYSLCVLSWSPQGVAFGSLGVLVLIGFALLLPKFLARIEGLGAPSESHRTRQGEQSSLDWLRTTTTEPEFIVSGQLNVLLEQGQDFVTKTGLDDEQIEVISVRAPSGAGKTRFARELGDRIRKSFEKRGGHCTVLFGDCDDPENPDSGTMAYEPFAEAMRAQLGVRRFEDPTQNARALQAGLADKGLQTVLSTTGLGALGSLLDVSAENENEIRKSTQAEMAQTIARALSTLSLEGKIVFILDDVQWIDADSEQLLEQVFELLPSRFKGNEVSFILTSRSEEPDKLQGLLERLQKEDVLSVLSLRLPTDEEHRKHWINKLFEQLRFDYLSQEQIRRLFEEKGYQLPLHISQAIIGILDRGWVEPLGDRFALVETANLEDLGAPSDFARFIEMLTAGLNPRTVDILHCCAIIGRRFRVSLVASIFRTDLLELLDMLEDAERLGVIRDDPDVDDVFEFCEKRTVSVFRNLPRPNNSDGSVMQVVREYRKRFVALQSEALEQRFGALKRAPFNEISTLAVHAAAIKDSHPREALLCCQLAAEMSQKKGLFQRAVKYFEEAISAATNSKDARVSPADEIGLRLSYIQSLQSAQQNAETVENNLDRLQALLASSNDDDFGAERVELSLCVALRAYRARDFSKVTSASSTAFASQHATTTQRLRAAFYMAAALPPQNPDARKQAHEAVVTDAERLIEDSRDPQIQKSAREVMSEACNNLGFAFVHGNTDLSKAKHWFERARELKQHPTVNDRKGLGIALGGLGDCAKEERDWKAARTYYEKNLEISREGGDLQGITRMTSMLAELDLKSINEPGSDRQERLRTARLGYQESLAFSKKQGNWANQAFAHAGLLQVARAEDSADVVKHELRLTEDFLDQTRTLSPPLTTFAAKAIKDALEDLTNVEGISTAEIRTIIESLTVP